MNEIENLQIRCVSHEIRNQISICEMYSEIIKKHMERDSYRNDSVFNAIECIKKSIKIMGNSLLDLKSMNNSELKAFNLNILINEAVRLSKAYTFGKNISISFDSEGDFFVFVDDIKFIACIVNIIKNACEAIDEEGYIAVKIIKDGDFVVINISNNGKVIPVEKQKEIFNEGYTTKLTGSGLGLHICNDNLKLFKSTLRLVKSDEISTEFEIKVPIYTVL